MNLCHRAGQGTSATGLARGWRQSGIFMTYAVRCRSGPLGTLDEIGTILLGIIVLSNGDFLEASRDPQTSQLSFSPERFCSLVIPDPQGRKGLE